MCSGNPITVGYNGRFLREAVIGMETIAQECCSEVCMEGRVTEGAPKGVTRTKSHPQRSGLEVTEPLGLGREVGVPEHRGSAVEESGMSEMPRNLSLLSRRMRPLIDGEKSAEMLAEASVTELIRVAEQKGMWPCVPDRKCRKPHD
jgi:hypothetical protein